MKNDEKRARLKVFVSHSRGFIISFEASIIACTQDDLDGRSPFHYINFL
jgi:hypothetical protein